MSENSDQLRRLLVATAQLNRDELAVVLEVAEGLVRGRDVYGPMTLSGDGRDYVTEAGEELRDALVYLSAQRIKLRRLAAT